MARGRGRSGKGSTAREPPEDAAPSAGRGIRRDRPPPREELAVRAGGEAPPGPGGPRRDEPRPVAQRRGVDREIYRLQQSHNYLSIPKAAFARVVKDIQHVPQREPLRFSTEALELLQAATEEIAEYLMYLFADGYLATAHRRRVTLSSEDVRLVRRLRQPHCWGETR
ncbi:HHT1 [Symbiodinium sp. CCMP2592]|nr:HHT1 [Symbiodinium sp. CCMP2592]